MRTSDWYQREPGYDQKAAFYQIKLSVCEHLVLAVQITLPQAGNDVILISPASSRLFVECTLTPTVMDGEQISCSVNNTHAWCGLMSQSDSDGKHRLSVKAFLSERYPCVCFSQRPSLRFKIIH